MANNRNNMHWRSGYAAYDNGLPLTANNNEPESDAFAQWHEGWKMAEEDDNPVDWGHTTPYCDACAELRLTSCSCEPDGYEED